MKLILKCTLLSVALTATITTSILAIIYSSVNQGETFVQFLNNIS